MASTAATSEAPADAVPAVCTTASEELGCPSSLQTEEGTQLNASNETNEAALGLPKLSKNQLKKLRKQEVIKAKNAYKKAKEKEKKKAQAEERKKEVRDMLAGLSRDEREAEYERRKQGRIQRLQERAQKKARQKGALAGGTDLVIDLEFGDLMEPHERKSLMQQLMYSYNRNSQAKRPYRLCLTGVAGDMKEQVHKITGFQNWMVVSEERPYIERFADRKGDLVYLTADAEETIQELDEGKVYIIGGIVDRNRHKLLTYNKAKAQGIAAAKLPIGEHLRMASSKVLTVNHVVELLVQFNELHDWQKTLELVVPTRKRAGEEHDRPATKPCIESRGKTSTSEPEADDGRFDRRRWDGAAKGSKEVEPEGGEVGRHREEEEGLDEEPSMPERSIETLEKGILAADAKDSQSQEGSRQSE